MKENKAMHRKDHWEDTYRTTAADEVGWYQAHPAMSLNLIASAGVDQSARLIDVGGGDSTLIDHLLDLGFQKVTVLDISGSALARAQSRLGGRASQVTWIESDITHVGNLGPYDLWHDRAVFHFLTDPDDRRRYLATLTQALVPHGHLIMATFGHEAPPICSGLPVVRYDARSLANELRREFELVEDCEQVHKTPGGKIQPFMYCRFLRRPNISHRRE
jgi:SAM-dependent methyltransferase